MTDEELAEFLLKVNTAYAEPCMLSGGDCKWENDPTRNKGCKDCFLEYLQSKAEQQRERKIIEYLEYTKLKNEGVILHEEQTA